MKFTTLVSKNVALLGIKQLGPGSKVYELGDYVERNVPSLKHFMSQGSNSEEYMTNNWQRFQVLCESYKGAAYQHSSFCNKTFYTFWLMNHDLAHYRYELKKNHGDWICCVKPDLGPGIKERVWESVTSTDDGIDICLSVKTELRSALTSLLGRSGQIL